MSTTAARLAELVGFALPPELLAVLADVPPSIAAFASTHGLAPFECPLYPDLETMLAANEEVRAEDIWTAEGPWPPAQLDIGVELSGDHFALLLSETPPGVHRLDHEIGTFVRITRTLAEFVAGLERVARGEVSSFSLAFPPQRDAGASPP